MKYEKNNEWNLIYLGDDAVLMNEEKDIVFLNDSAKSVYEVVEKGEIPEILSVLSTKYNCDKKSITIDVEDIIEKFIDAGVIKYKEV